MHEALTAALAEFSTPRFGYFDKAGDFVEVPDDVLETPAAPRWVGGLDDDQLLAAFARRVTALASAPAAGIDPASAPDDWRQYATEREETAQAVIERHRRELQTTGGMLAAARTRIAELEAVSAPAAEPYGWVYERADGFRMLHKAGDCQEAKLAADRDAAARYPDGHRLTTVYAAPTSDPQAQVAGWQPFETAPKEGEFLVYLPTARMSKVQTARRNINGVTVIGGAFAFDVEPATFWHPIPAVPPPEQEQPNA